VFCAPEVSFYSHVERSESYRKDLFSMVLSGFGQLPDAGKLKS